MRLVMTLLVRDEVDVVDAHLAFHLNAGVDFVIATDHRSVDGTTEILESYARPGYLRMIREEGEKVRQSDWVTRMARLAAVEHGADWVINSDADEFWWPRARSLKEALAAVPAHYGVVYAPMCYFVARRAPGPFYEAMTVRLLQPAPINNPLSRHRPSLKAAHRASPSVVVLRGNHEVERAGAPLRTWYPLELLHFPDRSPEQCARKYSNTVSAWPAGRAPGAFVLAAWNAIGRMGVDESFDHLAVTDAELGAAMAETLEVDTRLRDALRSLSSPHGKGFLRPNELGEPLQLRPPSAVDNTRHALDSAVLRDAELIRIHRRVDDLSAEAQACCARRAGHGLERLLRFRLLPRRLRT